MRDFTFNAFADVLLSFRFNGYLIAPFVEIVEQSQKSDKRLILRHDVDRFPQQTLQMARMEAKHDIRSTYYFRIIPSVFKPDILREVADLGHEIGYHYEDLSLCGGDLEKSIEHFEYNLEKLRDFYPIKTICMHGSPLSKWDNKSIWHHYDYKQYGIVADTSIDVDYNHVFYISDNGRGWNRTNVSIRDKVDSPFNIKINNTQHLIELINKGKLPDNVMINAHPDTFFDFGLKYYLNWGYIETKNIAKWFFVKLGLRK